MRRGRLALLALAVPLLGFLVLSASGSGGGAPDYGPLRPVVVLRGPVPEGRLFEPGLVRDVTAVRRVPASFVPPGTLSIPGDAVGMLAASDLPGGSYLGSSSLVLPGAEREARPSWWGRRSPVEIAVAGAGALEGMPPPEEANGGSLGTVDVIVTTEPDAGGAGRVFVGAAGVPLLAVGARGEAPVGAGLTSVTLALRRPEALRLVRAESFARKLTVVPRTGASG